MNILNDHYKRKLQQLQKLHDRTPEAVVHFLAGSLPAESYLHLRQLSLFNMITRLPNNILNRIARYTLITKKDHQKSWFTYISKLCSMYGLPHPLSLLDKPFTKEIGKKLCKTKVLEYWQNKLREDSAPLTSLKFFKPNFMSLNRPHPIWTTCGNNSFEVTKAIIQARLLSGRYRSEQLSSHFSPGSSPFCSICSDSSIGSVEHILIKCSALAVVRTKHLKHLDQRLDISTDSKALIQSYFNQSSDSTIQLLLDCSVLPEVILSNQNGKSYIMEEIFRFSRSWCYAMHEARMKLQGKWKNI